MKKLILCLLLSTVSFSLMARIAMPRVLCKDGEVKIEYRMKSVGDGFFCQVPKRVHCVKRSLCRKNSTVAPVLRRGCEVKVVSKLKRMKNGYSCYTRTAHYVKSDLCPMYSTLSPEYCRDGKVKVVKKLKKMRNGYSCYTRRAYCVSNSRCPLY